MGKLNTDFFNPPDVTIREEEDGAITVEGWADDLKEYKQSIKTLVEYSLWKKHFQKKHSKPRR